MYRITSIEYTEYTMNMRLLLTRMVIDLLSLVLHNGYIIFIPNNILGDYNNNDCRRHDDNYQEKLFP